MTEIEFHSGLDDPLGFCCRLLRKATGQGARVIVHADAEQAERLDRLLWVFDPLSFVPHARVDAARGAPAPAETPVWIVQRLSDAPHHEVLVNVAPDVAPGFESFARLIELVGTAPDDVDAGRRRWRHYGARGYALRHHGGGDA